MGNFLTFKLFLLVAFYSTIKITNYLRTHQTNTWNHVAREKIQGGIALKKLFYPFGVFLPQYCHSG